MNQKKGKKVVQITKEKTKVQKKPRAERPVGEQTLNLTIKQFVELAHALPKTKSDESAPLSLLKPELSGWHLVNSPDSPYLIYYRNDEYRADLSDALAAIDARILKGHNKKKNNEDDVAVSSIERMVWILMVIIEAETEGTNTSSGGFVDLNEALLSDLKSGLGKKAHEMWFSKNEGSSGLRAEELKRLFNRSVDGLMRLKYPSKANGTGEVFDKRRVAIHFGRQLCERLGRLPTKDEIINLICEKGHGYQERKSKGVYGKWMQLFEQCGLDGLK